MSAEARLDSPVIRLVRMPALSDTAEAQQMARAAGVDLFGWTRVERAAKDALIRLTLLRAKDGTPLSEINATLPADDGALAPAGPDEDPAASLPGCRSSWTGEPVTGVVLDIFPRRFKQGALDLYFADRIEGLKLGDGRLALAGGRWPTSGRRRWGHGGPSARSCPSTPTMRRIARRAASSTRSAAISARATCRSAWRGKIRTASCSPWPTARRTR
jgi:hypothetical protein